MSKQLWSGNSPKDKVEARLRICEATLGCIKRMGYLKTSMSDIAREAGIARPTLYRYFKSKPEAFITAIEGVGIRFAEEVARHAKKYDTAEDRIIEVIVFLCEKLPQDEDLSLAFDRDCSEVLASRAFSDDETTLEFTRIAIAPLIEMRPDLSSSADEIAEIMSRFAISLTLFPGKYGLAGDNLRDLIRRRLIPGLL